MHIISYACRAMDVCELTLAIIRLGQEQVQQHEEHEGCYDEFREV
jgi:hypothetical protein